MSFTAVKITSDYIVLPVSEFVDSVFVGLKINDEYVKDVILRLDYINPTTYSLLPVSEFKGREVVVEIDADIEYRNLQTNDPTLKKLGENFRPLIHYTADYGWINDPNGLVKYTSPVTGETVYHLFHQLNPYDWVWGNMHWGHAVSKDLYHWEHRPIALYPDEMGTMFSGSAVVDKENRSGLKVGDEDVILLFYTAAGHACDVYKVHKFTQCMAYSVDGGVTFQKYKGNPVVPHIEGANRDPKVVWCEELNAYVMALYLDKNDFCLLKSDNFIDWEMLQRFTVEGEYECPDFFPALVGNTRKWVYMGASGKYVLGEFVDGKFVFDPEIKGLYANRQSFAAQTFSSSDEYERIQIAWDNTAVFGNATFRGQMSIPYSLSLKEYSDGIRLCAEPYGLDSVRKEKTEYENIQIKNKSPYKIMLDGSSYELDLELSASEVCSDVKLNIFGSEIIIKKNASGIVNKEDCLPLDNTAETVCFKLIVDKGSLEAVSNNGMYMTLSGLMNYNRNCLVLRTDENECSNLKKLSITKLEL